MKGEHNRGRLEIRSPECLDVPPLRSAFPGARLAARLDTRFKRQGKWRFRLARGARERLQALIVAKFPNDLDL